MILSARTAPLAAALLLTAVPAAPQESEQEIPAPELGALESGWWTYFEGEPAEVEPKITSTLDRFAGEIGELTPAIQVNGESLLEAVRANLQTYLGLLAEDGSPEQDLPQPAASYSIDELFQLAANRRDAQSAAADDKSELDREERIRSASTRRRDTLFRDYADSEGADDRWMAGLRLVQARSALAISERRLELLTNRHERSSAFADAMVDRVELARERLAASPDAARLTELTRRVQQFRTAVEEAETELTQAERAAAGLSGLGRSERRLQQQARIDAEVKLQLARIRQAIAEGVQGWHQLRVEEDSDIDALTALTQQWTELAQQSPELGLAWKTATQEELLRVQSVSRSQLDRDAQRLLDQRLTAAQQTLTRLGELDGAVDDLQLVIGVVERAAEDYSGPLSSWFSRLGRSVNALFESGQEIGDYRLFSIGNTPVTIGAIFKVLIILTLAFWLSRGVRHALERMSQTDSSGRALLYTVGRLLHYIIIFSGLVIALTAIGLDFTNVALVAGALSVGIGFGLQSIVSNFVSGLIILFEQTQRVGDYIELETGLTGTVKSINVRSTLINTNDNIDIVVPNSEFVTARLTNWTLGERILRVRIPFGVAYGTDKELVRTAALEAAEKVPYTLTHMKGRKPDVWLVEYGDNSLIFLLLVWVNRQGARRPTRTRAAYLWELGNGIYQIQHRNSIPAAGSAFALGLAAG